MINFVDERERVNSKDNFDANPSVKAAEFSEVYIDLIKLDNKHKSKHYNITIHILFPDRDEFLLVGFVQSDVGKSHQFLETIIQ